MAAGVVGDWTPPGYKPPPVAPTSMFGNPATFTAAANTQADDYDKIMKNYGDIVARSSDTGYNPISMSSNSVGVPGSTSFSPVSYSAIAPQQSKYRQSSDVSSSLDKLSELSTTGGYDAAGIADLRARGIAPTRSIYANAQQNIERQRALGGGYSPNFNATQAQLARDESNQISDINTNVNAGIAQNVASNRIAAAPAYASASASANAEQAHADQRNADIINQINELNSQNQLRTNEFNAEGQLRTNEFNVSGRNRANELNVNNQLAIAKANQDAKLRATQGGQNTALAATEGMRGLYGTTPALTSTFGNQVVQAGQLGQGQQSLNNQKQGNLYNLVGRFGG